MTASKFSKELKLPLADSIIYATAIIFDAEIYSLDKRFEYLPKVKYLEKNLLNFFNPYTYALLTSIILPKFHNFVFF